MFINEESREYLATVVASLQPRPRHIHDAAEAGGFVFYQVSEVGDGTRRLRYRHPVDYRRRCWTDVTMSGVLLDTTVDTLGRVKI